MWWPDFSECIRPRGSRTWQKPVAQPVLWESWKVNCYSSGRDAVTTAVFFLSATRVDERENDLRHFLLLAGDMESNPGPSTRRPAQHHLRPCGKCKKNVPYSRKFYSTKCSACSYWFNEHCTRLSYQWIVTITKQHSEIRLSRLLSWSVTDSSPNHQLALWLHCLITLKLITEYLNRT